MSHGFTVLANYTWSKSMDDLPANTDITTVGASGNSPIPWNFPGRHQDDYGASEFDHTHRFIVSYVWDLPKLVGQKADRTCLRGIPDCSRSCHCTRSVCEICGRERFVGLSDKGNPLPNRDRVRVRRRRGRSEHYLNISGMPYDMLVRDNVSGRIDDHTGTNHLSASECPCFFTRGRGIQAETCTRTTALPWPQAARARHYSP